MAEIIQKCLLAVFLVILITGPLGCSNPTRLKGTAGVNSQTTGPSGGGDLIWVKSAGGVSGSAVGHGITKLPDDSIVVTGQFSGSATFGSGEPNQIVLSPDVDSGMFIARYNPDAALVWAKCVGGAELEGNTGITTFSDNSIVVTGVFEGSVSFGRDESNQTVLSSDGESDIFIACYNPDGTLAWAKRAGGVSFDQGIGITTLSDNSIVVTGVFDESSTFGLSEPNQTVLTSAGIYDIYIARYNTHGTLAWAKRAGGVSYEYSRGITALSDNSTVVTGFFYDSATFGPGELNQTVLTSAGNRDFFIARYNPDGTLAWANRAGGALSEICSGIMTLSDNSTVVTGWFYESATFGPGEPNQTVLTSAGSWDIFIARYNPDGTLAWAKNPGGASADVSFGIATLSDNSIVLTGRFGGSATFGPGEPNQTAHTDAGGGDIFIVRYNPDGTLAWAKCAGGASHEWGNGITALSDDSTVVTGWFSESATFGPDEVNETVLTSMGDVDFFIARFKP